MGSMKGTIGIIIGGVIGLIVLFNVTPTIFGSFGQLFNLTNAGCTVSGERFTAVNTSREWDGTTTALTGGTGSTCVATGVTDAALVYSPQGKLITASAADTLPGEWSEPLPILNEQMALNKLVITVLPIVAVVGIFGALAVWHRRSQPGMG